MIIIVRQKFLLLFSRTHRNKLLTNVVTGVKENPNETERNPLFMRVMNFTGLRSVAVNKNSIYVNLQFPGFEVGEVFSERNTFEEREGGDKRIL